MSHNEDLNRRSRICSCNCDPACNCQCSCAFPEHCVCSIPCKKKCGESLPRNLVVSLDGTSNKFGVYNTNVVEMHSRIDGDDKDNQRKYYNCGLGTYVPYWDRSWWTRLNQWSHNLLELTVAWNFNLKILKAYQWLSRMYRPGDRIFLFGFSRGAYQVRTLAAMIEKVGLVHSGNEEMIPFAYEIYEERRGKTSLAGGLVRKLRTMFSHDTINADGPKLEDIAGNFKRSFSRDVRIHFVGVWDTVSSIGLVREKPLPLTWTAEHICIFRHALALDEQRVKFLPEYVRGGASISYPAEGTIAADVKEVWFAGTHSDIGGGSRKNLQLDLSSIPLLWMENQAASAGLRLKPRDSGGAWEMTKFDHDDLHKSLSTLWKLFEQFPVKHLSYMDPTENVKTRHKGAGRIIVPGQLVHVSVAFRNQDYIPKATFLDEETLIEWSSFVGKVLNSDSAWARDLSGQLEMDLFDAPFTLEAIKHLWKCHARGGTLSPEESKNQSYWIKRLAFIALSGNIAAHYVGQLQADSTEEKRLDAVQAAREMLEQLPNSGVPPNTFDAVIAAFLEHEGILEVRKKPEEALKTYKRAEDLRRKILSAPSASWQARERLARCLEHMCGLFMALGRNAEALAYSEETVDLRRQIRKQCGRGNLTSQSLWLVNSLLLRFVASDANRGPGPDPGWVKELFEVASSIITDTATGSPQQLANALESTLSSISDALSAIRPSHATKINECARELRRELARFHSMDALLNASFKIIDFPPDIPDILAGLLVRFPELDSIANAIGNDLDSSEAVSVIGEDVEAGDGSGGVSHVIAPRFEDIALAIANSVPVGLASDMLGHVLGLLAESGPMAHTTEENVEVSDSSVSESSPSGGVSRTVSGQTGGSDLMPRKVGADAEVSDGLVLALRRLCFTLLDLCRPTHEPVGRPTHEVVKPLEPDFEELD